MFASRMNAQLHLYCSWRPDPTASMVDALSISWKDHYPYVFPPTAFIPHCLDKLREEKVTATLIVPNQIWFSQLLKSFDRPSFQSSSLPLWPTQGPETYNGNGRSPSTGHLAFLWGSYRAEGLSDRVISTIRKSWQMLTESAYSSIWQQSDSWCFERGIDLHSAPLDDILEFLFKQFERGKLYIILHCKHHEVCHFYDTKWHRWYMGWTASTGF